MSRKTSFVRAGLTSAAGLVGIGVSGAVVLALCLIPFPVLEGAPLGELVNPTAATATRVCPGPLLSVQTRDGDATSFVAFEAPTTVYASTSEPLSAFSLSFAGDTQGDGLSPLAVTVPPPSEGSPVLLAGAQSQSVEHEDMAGLAATGCLEPEAESWLVGGATDLGQSTLIRLSNPSETDSSAHIEVYGETGRIAPSRSNDVVVPAGTEQVLSLAALAPDLAMPVVHVTSSGGSLVATLQQTLVRTIVPSGVEVIEPGTSANTAQVITGVRLVDMARFSDSEGGAVTSDEEPAVRVLATSLEPSDVVVTTIARDGSTTEVKATLNPGVVLQLPFNAVPDGMYTVIVSGTTPIVASVRSVVPAGVDPAQPSPALTPTATPGATLGATPAAPSGTATPTPTPQVPAGGVPLDGVPMDGVPMDGGFEGGDGPGFGGAGAPSVGAPAELVPLQTGGDFTWYPASAALGASTLFGVASAPFAELTVYNGLESTKSLVLSSDGQPDVAISVDARSFVSVDVMPGAVYRLEGDPGLRAAVTYSGVGLSSVSSVRPPSRLGSTILVYPR